MISHFQCIPAYWLLLRKELHLYEHFWFYVKLRLTIKVLSNLWEVI